MSAILYFEIYGWSILLLNKYDGGDFSYDGGQIFILIKSDGVSFQMTGSDGTPIK